MFYRIEHSESGVGPFRHHIKDNVIMGLVWKRIEYLTENHTDYPLPVDDNNINEIWKNCKKRDFVFACSSVNEIERWLGEDLLAILLNNGFYIRVMKPDRDFSNYYIGTNQVLLEI